MTKEELISNIQTCISEYVCDNGIDCMNLTFTAKVENGWTKVEEL